MSGIHFIRAKASPTILHRTKTLCVVGRLAWCCISSDYLISPEAATASYDRWLQRKQRVSVPHASSRSGREEEKTKRISCVTFRAFSSLRFSFFSFFPFFPASFPKGSRSEQQRGAPASLLSGHISGHTEEVATLQWLPSASARMGTSTSQKGPPRLCLGFGGMMKGNVRGKHGEWTRKQ